MGKEVVYYKYRKVDSRTLTMLLDGKIHFSTPEKLNDPSECRPHLQVDCSENDLIDLCKRVMWNKQLYEFKNTWATAQIYGLEGNQYPLAQLNRASHEFFDKSLKTWRMLNKHGTIAEFCSREIERSMCNISGDGVFSASERKNNFLMWSHYADEHKGICIGYKVPESGTALFQKVEYGVDRIVKASDVDAWLNGDREAAERIRKVCFYRKAKEWDYEKEWRSVRRAGDAGYLLKIHEIVFGERCDPAVQFLIMQALTNYITPIKYTKMVMNEGGFGLTSQPIGKTALRDRYAEIGYTEIDLINGALERRASKDGIRRES